MASPLSPSEAVVRGGGNDDNIKAAGMTTMPVALSPASAATDHPLRPMLAPTPRTRSTTSLHQRPTWMHLAADISTTSSINNKDPSQIPQSMSSQSLHDSTNNYSRPTRESEMKLLAPTFSSPRAASTAHQCGLLKSLTPSAITSKYGDCHSSMRLAFRYLTTPARKQYTEKNYDDEKDDDEEDLFLCWIDEHGVPFHFRRLRPKTATDAASKSTTNSTVVDDAQQNATTANDTITTTIPMVNESDHIEKTYPGHAFVLCRKVTKRSLDGVDNDDKDGNLQKFDSVRGGDDTSISVAHRDGMTYFLRKRRREKKSRDCNNEDCYLVVGGFRPGPMPHVQQKNGKNEEGEKEGTVDEERDDDDDDDDNDMYVQLVTITRLSSRPHANADDFMSQARNSKTKSCHHSVATTKREFDTDDDDEHEHEDSPTSSWKTLCCACFPGMANTKSHRTPAFLVASAISQADLSTSSLTQILPRLPKHGNQITTVKNVDDDNECILDITVTLSRLDPTPIDTSSKHYDAILLGDWPCRIEPGCFPSNMTDPTGKNLLQCRFEADILAASASLPPHARERLKKSTPIWINKSSCYGPKVSPIIDRDACFHPGTEWLIKNGMNPAKCGGVEWYNAQHYLCDCDLWGPGGQVLHELSHAWHCLHIEGGYDNEEIINVYNSAMEEGLYDCVRVHDLHGKTKECKAYACNNPMEYFAELSVAFLGGVDNDAEHNKWYPFNRRQLREHDPRAFDMLCRMWEVDVDDGES